MIVPLERVDGTGRPTLFDLNVLSADSSARDAWRATSAWSWRHDIANYKITSHSNK